MCETGGEVHVPSVAAAAAGPAWKGEVLRLEPVDSVSVLTVCDNSIDILLPGLGPARRLPLGGPLTGAAPALVGARTLEAGETRDWPAAEHGFSVLVEIRKDGATRRLLFDTGSPRPAAPTTWAASAATCGTSRHRAGRRSGGAPAYWPGPGGHGQQGGAVRLRAPFRWPGYSLHLYPWGYIGDHGR